VTTEAQTKFINEMIATPAGDWVSRDFGELEQDVMAGLALLVETYHERCDAFDKTIEAVRDRRPPKPGDLSSMQRNARYVAEELASKAGLTVHQFRQVISQMNKRRRYR